MLNKIKVVTFLLALVIGTLMFLDKAYAQFGFVGHPVCPADNCVADLLDCNCEQECIFGTGGDPISGTADCAAVQLGFLDCVGDCAASEDVSGCVASCRTILYECLEENCMME